MPILVLTHKLKLVAPILVLQNFSSAKTHWSV